MADDRPTPLAYAGAGLADEGADETAVRRRGRQAMAVSTCLLVAVCTAVLGWAGLLGALSFVAVLVGIAALSRVPAAPPPRPAPRPGPPVENAPFRSYRQVAEAMSWAEVSPRHYDLGTRPVLARLLAARLADHHGVDLTADPAAARALVGEEVWHWLDTDREVDRRGQPPGLDQPTLSRIVDRLEQL